MRRSAILTLACMPLMLVACSDGDSLASESSPTPEQSSAAEAPPSPSEPTSDPDLPSDDDIQAFMETIANQDPSELEAAQEYVVEGSPADDYLLYSAHNADSAIDGGITGEPNVEVNPIEGGFEICDTFQGEETCAAYTDFVGESGKIYSFNAGGSPLEEKLTVGSGTEIEGPGGSSVELVAAYENAYGTHLFVAYKLRSGTQDLDFPMVSYRGADGRQSQVESLQGGTSLAPESMSHYTAAFPGAELGGELLLDIYGPDVQGGETVVVPTSE